MISPNIVHGVDLALLVMVEGETIAERWVVELVDVVPINKFKQIIDKTIKITLFNGIKLFNQN